MLHRIMKNNKNIVILLTTILTTQTVCGLTVSTFFLQDVYTDSIHNRDIHTVLLRSASWERSLPVIELNSDQQLELIFDDLSDKTRYFSYTLIHCTREWQPSSLSRQQFLGGFGDGEISEQHRSFNTTHDYVHYRLKFPDQPCVPALMQAPPLK